jgi:transposase-like protein
MILEPILIVSYPNCPGHFRGLFLKASVGLSIVIATTSSIHLAFYQKQLGSHKVNQPSCHSEHRSAKITPISTSVRQCKGCGQVKDQSAFASKGRDRPSALCKECDNHRRRSTYSPKEVAPDWDQVAIALEPAPAPELDTAKLVMELLDEFHLQGRTQQQEKSIADSIIEGGTSLDDLIRS